MSLRRLPRIENLERPDDDGELFPGDREQTEYQNHMAIRLAEKPAGTSIDMFGPIGRNFFGDGIDDKFVNAALKNATGDVTVNINSPGGSYFQGLAIFNLLSMYSGRVIVNIIGTAASAASLIAMAGDVIRISAAGSVMIHNAQAGVEGDRHDLEDGANALSEIDAAIRSIYAARTGQKDAALDSMMTPSIGTWLFGQAAIDKGFADELLATDKVVEDKTKAPEKGKNARNQLDAILAKSGVKRSQRRELYRNAFPGKIGAEADPDPSPGSGRAFAELASVLREVADDLKKVTPRADQTTPNAGHLDALEKLGRIVETTV